MTVMVKLSTSVLEELWFGEDDPAVADGKAADSLAAHLAEIEGLRPSGGGAESNRLRRAP